MICIRIDVYWGEYDGRTIYDTYQINHKPILLSGKNEFHDKEIESIIVTKEMGGAIAEIYYKDGSFQYTENVKRYFYAKAQSRTRQGEASYV